MTVVHASEALTPAGWRSNVRVVTVGGVISEVVVETDAKPGDERVSLLLPGMPNLHSHAFQRAMAGLTERRGSAAADSFWSWRDTMYRFALAMTPEQVQAVATQLYVEMLEAGFTRVGEFHYLHHDRDGSRYANPAEMGERVAAAASESGIGLTLLPVFYAHSGFGGAEPVNGQRRFVSSIDGYASILEGCRIAVAKLDGATVGIAPHSLRAVTPGELAVVTEMASSGPLHIHVAEQSKEVEDCVGWSGARPVQWLLANAQVDARWCLIHATHMTPEETSNLAKSGAVAGLCPVTEANLGDGIFNAAEYLAAGGTFGVGSDSNVLVGVPDELRQLEYSQRLRHQARNIIAAPGQSNGRALYEAALLGGTRALGTTAPGLAIGARADFLSLRSGVPTLTGMRPDDVVDGWTFARAAAVDAVWVRGKKVVDGGRHHAREVTARAFERAMHDLVR